jgi:hypothetical protein
VHTGAHRQAESSAGAATIAASHEFMYAFAATDDAVYFVDKNGLQSVPTTGGAVQVIANQIGTDATGLGVVGSNIVVTTGSSGGTVLSVPITGGPPSTLATNQPNPSFPLACGADTCWWTGASASPMGPTGPGYIARLTGANTISAPVYPWSLVFDGSNFFQTVGCDVCSGSLVRISPSGAPSVMVAPGSYVAVDDECAYFSVVLGFGLPAQAEGGLPGAGIYSVAKSFTWPSQ